jgi:hypothetical protein
MIFHFDCQIGGNALNEMRGLRWGKSILISGDGNESISELLLCCWINVEPLNCDKSSRKLAQRRGN